MPRPIPTSRHQWPGHLHRSTLLPSYDELYPGPRSSTTAQLRPVEDPTGALQVDLEAAPGNLQRMAQARADKFRDLVLLTSDSSQLDIAANLIANLASVGVDHYILVGDKERTCQKVVGRVACVWSTLLEPGYSARLRKAATNPVRALWLVRQMYVGRLARLGYNPMMLDADVIVFANPFALIRKHLPGYQIYVLGDTSAGWMSSNAGTLYVRGSECSDAGNPAQRVWLEFERRVFALLNTSAPFPSQQPHKVKGGRIVGGGRPADALLYDQNVLDWNMLGVMLHDYEFVGRGFSPNQRALSAEEKAIIKYRSSDSRTPTPTGFSLPGWPYTPGRYELREVSLPRVGETAAAAAARPVHEQVRMLKAPPWLFSAESDEYGRRRVTAEHWHVQPPAQALIHFVCSRWPGSDGRKVEMRLLGRWFAPDIAYVTGKAVKPREPLIAFASTVPLSRQGVTRTTGVHRPALADVMAWSQLLALLAFDTQRKAVQPLFECAGLLAPGQRHGWVLSAETPPGLPRKLACAYRVGVGCFDGLAYPEEVARTPRARRLVVPLSAAALEAEGVLGLMRQLRAAVAGADGRPAASQPDAVLVDVESLAGKVPTELLSRRLNGFFQSRAQEPWAADNAAWSTFTRRLQELKMIRRWHREAARNASDPRADAAGAPGRAGRRGRGRGLGGHGGGGGRGASPRKTKGRRYNPGGTMIGGAWGSRLIRHTCGDGMVRTPSRQPYVC